MAVLTGAAMLVGPLPWYAQENLGIFAWTGMAAAAGDAVRSRRAFVDAIRERAERAERTREEEARRRVAEERLRIARDLHDVVAHHIALVNVQAGVAAHVMDKRPDQAKEALAHVREASRSALNELRATVGLLRQSGDPEAPTEPAPGLAVLDELVDTFRNAGLPRRGRPAPTAAPAAARRRRPGRVPGHPGGPDQRAASTRHRGEGRGAASYASGPNVEITVLDNGAAGEDRRTRRRRRRPRPDRHAGARSPRCSGTLTARPPLRRRLPRPCDLPRQDPHATARPGPEDGGARMTDPCPARRRPGAAAQRVPGAGRLRARHGGGRRGVRRRRGGRGWPAGARADVVLMDIRMPGTDGLAATRMISADPELAEVRVVILTTFEIDEYVVQALRAGASGFLGKGAEPEELLDAIRIAAGGRGAALPGRHQGADRPLPRPGRRDGRRPRPGAAPSGSPRSPCGNARCSSGRRRPLQRRDRRAPRRQPAHRQDPRQPGHGEAGRPGPGPTRRHRLRVGAGAPRVE